MTVIRVNLGHVLPLHVFVTGTNGGAGYAPLVLSLCDSDSLTHARDIVGNRTIDSALAEMTASVV